MKRYATLTVIGKDRSGVIARFTGALFQMGANIEALEEQVHRGKFSMTLQASWATPRFEEAAVRRGLAALAEEVGMDLTLRVLKDKTRPRGAILVTKEPGCLQALLKARLPCDFVVAAGNHPALGPKLREAGIPFVHIPWQDRVEGERALLRILEKHEVDFIVLARFMKILSPDFVWRWKNKILNIHPSLLPSFPGANAYRQAFEKGVRVAGVTAHFVTPDLDEGPILWQEAFRVPSSWDIPQIVRKGQELEGRALVKAVRLFLRKRFDIYWGKVHEREEE